MAAKNRKRNNDNKSGFAFPVPAAVFLAMTVTLLLLYVWLDTHGQALGTRIKRLESQRIELNKAYAHELSKWEMLKSPASIEKALAKNRLVMIAPEDKDVVRLRARPTAGIPGPLARLRASSGIMVND